MRVFALDQRFSGIVPEVFFALVVVPVHRADDVGVAAAVVVDRTFVMDRPRGVVSLDPVVAGVEIGAVARLVAQRPDDDRRMVDIAPHVADVAFQMRLGVGGILGQRLFVVAHAVRFEVGLGHQIESIAVAERVPAGVVRVVARAHGVEIVLLEDADVLDHPLFRDDIPAVGVHFVTVGAFDKHGLSVHQQLSALDLHLAEARVQGDDFDRFSGRVFQGHRDAVERGNLRRPRLHPPGVEHETGYRTEEFRRFRSYGLAVGVRERHLRRVAPGRRGESQLHGEPAAGVVLREGRVEPYVGDMAFVAGIEEADAAHAREAEEVLIFEIGAVAPAEDLEGEEILAGLHEARDVELAFEFRILAVTDEPSVDPQVDVRGDGPEPGDDLLVRPRGRDLDFAAVRADMVFFYRHVRRIVFELFAPCVADVEILRIAVAVQFPQSRNGHRAPRAVVVVRAEEIRGTLVGVADPREFPRPVEVKESFRDARVALPGGFCGFIGEIRSPHRQAVDFVHRGIEPFVASGPESGGRACAQQGQDQFFHRSGRF